MGFALLIIGFVIVAGAIAYFSWLSAKKRREALAALAAQRGWHYEQRDDRWCQAFDGSPFGQGHNRKATNVLSGEYDGRPFVAFDYVYYTTETSTDSQGHTTTREEAHHFGITGLDMGVPFPALEVTPEGMLGRFIGRITNRDIELESEDFNRAFTVHCPDRKFAFDVLHPRMMEYLLTHRDEAFRFDRAWILSVNSGNAKIEEIEPRLALINGIVDQIPEFVWKEVRG